tara:strand:- start:111 stop:443 length:333 start_codon:yes stop_codon:yes gene_type:complete
MSDENVVNFPKPEDATDTLFGPARLGADLIYRGCCIPKIHIHDLGGTVNFILDDRFSFEFPREWAYLAAAFASEAMAIGAGFPAVDAKKRDTFAPQCFGAELPEGQGGEQ